MDRNSDSDGLDIPSEVGDGEEVPPGALVAQNREGLREEAEEFAATWSEYGLDFTPDSLARLDEVFATQQERANYLQIELDDGRTGAFAPMASMPACYFGETMIRNYEAEWVFDDDFGWALGVAGQRVVNLFGAAHDALDAQPPFVSTHDTFVTQFDIDGEPLEVDGTRTQVVSVDDGIDPDDFDDEEIETGVVERDPDAIREQMADDAGELVESWPGYDLDFSVDSLGRLDGIVEAELAGPAFDDAEIGSTDDEESIALTAYTVMAGAYFGEVFRRTTGASWAYSEENGQVVKLPAAGAYAQFNPVGIAEECIDGEDTFHGTYQTTLELVDEVEDELAERDESDDAEPGGGR